MENTNQKRKLRAKPFLFLAVASFASFYFLETFEARSNFQPEVNQVALQSDGQSSLNQDATNIESPNQGEVMGEADGKNAKDQSIEKKNEPLLVGKQVKDQRSVTKKSKKSSKKHKKNNNGNQISGTSATRSPASDTSEPSPSESSQPVPSASPQSAVPVPEKAKVILTIDTGAKQYEFNEDWESGMTAFELLKKISGRENFSFKYQDSSFGVFVEEIHGVENDDSESKYWMFKVNGKLSEVGCSDYKLGKGDSVKWMYEKVSW
jgi:hypothetical protein